MLESEWKHQRRANKADSKSAKCQSTACYIILTRSRCSARWSCLWVCHPRSKQSHGYPIEITEYGLELVFNCAAAHWGPIDEWKTNGYCNSMLVYTINEHRTMSLYCNCRELIRCNSHSHFVASLQ